MGAPSPNEAVLTLGKYTLLEKIGEGYLGPVYRGFDQDLDRAVAVRILCNGIRWDPKIEESYKQQCLAVASLNHRNIASIFDLGKEGQLHFIVMESMGSASLQSVIAQKSPMTAEAKVAIMIQVAEGLAYAHQKGTLHRDLAPAKIHMTADGTAKIRDFAIAHILRKHLPHPAIRWGTPIYLSPEQVQQRDCDPRSDIFSAGTIFYEFLTYRHPFYDRDSNKALDNVLLSTEIPTFELFPDEPPAIWPILKTCLEKNPKDRYQGIDELAGACKDFLKDLAEDTRLMLAELYAALSPLKLAVAQPHAPETTVQLLKDIQKLLTGEKQADYASLDRLMTVLLEQYPVIRAAAGARSTTDPADMQLLPEEAQAACADEASQAPLPAPAAAQPPPQAERPLPVSGAQNSIPPAMQAVPPVSAPVQTQPDGDPHGCSESSFAAAWDVSPAPQSIPAPPIPEEQTERTPAAEPQPVRELQLSDLVRRPRLPGETAADPEAASKPQRRGMSRSLYRTAAALLALLIIAAAAYILWETRASASTGSLWKSNILNSRSLSGAIAFLRGNSNDGTVSAAGTEAPGPADTSQARLSPLAENGSENLPGEDAGNTASRPPQGSVARISALINSGKLQLARAELDTLQKSYPASSRVLALRRQLQTRDSAATQEQSLREQEQLNAARRQKEDEWNRQVNALLANGKYNEAEGVLDTWLAENPGNWNALELEVKTGEIQRNLKTYSAAMAENRYQDALSALGNAERINPADSTLAELRRQAEVRKANARATLIIYRLGPKGVLFMDGRPISNDGEIESSNIPIGPHLLTIEHGGSTVVSRRLEFVEGQRIALVHDLERHYLRAMTESDRELLEKRKAMEEARFFDVEHVHGAFRGSCRGTLAVDYMEISYKPSSGRHEFRMPFKLLKLSVNGKSVTLLNSSDGSQFQSFKLRNEQTAAKFRESWDELKAFAQQVAENR